MTGPDTDAARRQAGSDPSPSRNSSFGEKASDDEKPAELHDGDQSNVTPPERDDRVDIEKQKQNVPDGDDERDPNVVDFDGPDDHLNPQNWKTWRKWCNALAYSMMTFTVTFASSVFSTATMPTAQEFGVSEEVMILGVSLFVVGFAAGPIVWGPFSELYGRKIPLFFGFIVFGIFNIPVAVAQNLQTIFICRFLGGFFASAPLAIVGGVMGDMFDPVNRGVAMGLFCGATFIGPVMGPILGGFITMSHLGWRWTQWLTLIMAALFGLIAIVVVPETFAPVILQRKAKRLRYQTRNWALHAPADEHEVNLKEIANKYLMRPFNMLVFEPILVLVTIYMSLIYGILYGFFEVFPIAFQQERGWNEGVGALPFLSVLIGVTVGVLFITAFTKKRFKHVMEANGAPVPEERLIPMIIGGFFMPAGLFWFAWTSNPSITPWPQIISCSFIGIGVNMIFLQGLTYILDVYKMNANSAISANTFARSLVGAGFPMFATPMFNNLGVPWAMSLLGFLCAALFPVPILFYIYGSKIRKMSRFVPE